MGRAKNLTITLVTAFLVLISNTECQLLPGFPTPRPLCLSQFALVNHACSMLPITPHPPPAPPASDQDGQDQDNQHGHGHRRRHRHRHHQTPAQEGCCRWLKEVDNECVCEMLVRLPIFLARPVHEYTVMVDDICVVTYTCGGRLRV